MLLSSGRPIATSIDLADATPMRNTAYYASTGLALTSHFAAYAALYRAQPWVFTLVTKLATSAARLPLKVFERVSTTDRVPARDTAYGELIRNPCPKMGPKLLWLWVFSTRELYGEAILLKLRDDKGRVRELHPVHPSNMLVRRREDGEVEYGHLAYGGGTDATLMRWPASEVIHFRGYNPENTVRGVSPCEPLRQTLLSEDAMRRATTSLWRNGARPSVVLSSPNTLSAGAIERIKAQWDAAHSGVDSWGKTAVLEEGLTPHLEQLSSEELQYIEGRRLNREECCAVWDVPPPAVQILDRATFSNITEQMRSLYRETTAPRLEAAEDVLATQLAPDFAGDGDLYAEWVMDDVLRGSFEARIAAKAQAIGTGQMTPAESRAQENLPFVEGSDRLLVNAALIPLGAVEAVTAGTDTGVAEPPQKIKGLSAGDARKVAGRLSRTATVADVDATKVTAGLPDDAQAEVNGLIAAATARSATVAELRSWVAAAVADPFEINEDGAA